MRVAKLRSILNEFNAKNPSIEDSAIVLSDGLVVASNLAANIDEDKIGTISAAIFSLATDEAKQLNKGNTEQVFIKCGGNYIAMFKAGENAVLVIDFNESTNIDGIVKEAVEASVKIVDSL